MKKRDEKINYLIDKIKQNELISKKSKKVCRILIYTEHIPILVSTVTGSASISAFASLVSIIVVITAGIKNHTSIIKRKK